MNAHHKEILAEIEMKSGNPTQHTALDNYLGTSHRRFLISNPVLREIVKNWARSNNSITTNELIELIDSLIIAESFTEKIAGGLLLDYVKASNHTIPFSLFDRWLESLEGWCEVDTLCTCKYLRTEIPLHWASWKKYLVKLPQSKSIAKRRASLVFLCAVAGKNGSNEIAAIAFLNITKMMHEKDLLITKAVSWLLRSMVALHKKAVSDFINENENNLPAIALRETRAKLKTGRKG